MAETDRLRAVEVCWLLDDSDVDSALVNAPGVKDPGNQRPSRPGRVKGRRTLEVRAGVPVCRRPVSESIKVGGPLPKSHSNKFSTDHKREAPQETKKTDKFQSTSLKDLCTEDKQRVANLINELARVSEEKNKVAEALNNEKLQFERQMKNLVEHQEQILQERQAVQQQLWECQNLLSQYQHLVSTQQHVLDTHVSARDKESPRDGSIVGDSTDSVPTEADRRQHQQPSAKQHYGTIPNKAVSLHPRDVAPLSLSGHAPKHVSGESSQPSSGADTARSLLQSARIEKKPGSARKIRVPTVAETDNDRPFTTYIDGLIASEQEGSQCSHSTQSCLSSHKEHGPGRMASHSSISSGTILTNNTQTRSRIKAQQELAFYSTHQNDGLSTSQNSRTKAGEFRQLQPDSSPRSSLLSMATTHPLDEFSQHLQEVQYNNQEDLNPLSYGRAPAIPSDFEVGTFPKPSVPGLKVNFPKQLQCNNPSSAPNPPPSLPGGPQELSDYDFVTYYKSMSVDERQRHLQTQKTALLTEQERLRRVLDDHEKLLQRKQHQLHVRQDMQSRRLQHFEQTDSSFEHKVQPPIQRQFNHEGVDSNLPNDVRLNRQYEDGCPARTLKSTHRDPYMPGPLPVERRLPYHRRPDNLEDVTTTKRQFSMDTDGAFNGLQGSISEMSQEEIIAITESFKNNLFLQEHGIDWKGFRSDGIKNVASLTAPVGVPSSTARRLPRDGHRVETMDDLLNHSRGSSRSDVIGRGGKKVVRKPGGHRSNHQLLTDSDYAAGLLELVDEVENSRLDRGGEQGFPGVEPSAMQSGATDALNTEDADESRILEEVFFVM